MITSTKSAASLQPGDALPAAEKTFTAVELVMYGAATWDWHRLHYDPDFADAMQLPGPVVDGQVYGAMFAKQALDWLGPKAFVRRLVFRMRSMAFAGDTLRLEGEVIELRDGRSFDVVVLDQRLTNNGRRVAEATTEVRLPR